MKPCEDGHVVTTKVGIQFITELTDCNTGLFLGGGEKLIRPYFYTHREMVTVDLIKLITSYI